MSAPVSIMVRPLTPLPGHLRGLVFVVVRRPIDDLLSHLLRSADPRVAQWAKKMRDGA